MADFTGSHIRSPNSAGAGTVALMLPLRELLEKRDLLGDEARLLRRELVDDDGPRPAVGRIAAQLEAVRQLGDHADVALAPPFAVGDHVEPGRFLQRHGGANRVAHQPAVFVALERAIVGDQVLHAAAAASRSPTWETGHRRSCHFSRCLVVQFSPRVLEILLRIDFDVAARRIDVRNCSPCSIMS